MISCTSSQCSFIKKYYITLVSVFSILIFVFFLNFVSIIYSYGNYINKQLTYSIENIIEDNDNLDFSRLCKISNCDYIYSKIIFEGKITNKLYLIYRKDLNKKHIVINPKLTNIYRNFYLYNNNVVIHNNEANAYFSLNLTNLYIELRYTYITTLFFVFSIILTFLYFSYKKEQKEHIIQTIGSEAILANQSMIMITENVHHELNTPLEVIDNKIEKIHRIITDYLVGLLNLQKNSDLENNTTFMLLNRSLINLEADFNFIKTASEQIYSVLEKMKGFKHLRYSNGNKTIYDIVEGAVKIINISNSGFTYKIDSNLKDYKIKSNGDKTLKNVDLLNVILNHLKNSLEAKAGNIEIKVFSFKDNILKLHIIDNGNGIPADVVNKIFLPNFSTKTELKAIRGNGMYLNKFIMDACGGGIKVVDTNTNGTIIEISLLSKYHEYRIY
jgi:signal transduction histidine kinase